MKKGIILIAALALLPASAFAEVRKCVGPEGQLKFTDRECPEGFAEGGLEPLSSSSDRDAGGPYICRYPETLSPYEIDNAVARARIMIKRLKGAGEHGSAAYWERCLSRLEDRMAKIRAEREKPAERKKGLRIKKVSADPLCRYGNFSTEAGVYDTRFDVIFSNLSDRACRKVLAVCTYSLGWRIPYTVSVEVHYDGRIDSGETTAIGTVHAEGGRTVNWSTCRFKKSRERSWPVAR